MDYFAKYFLEGLEEWCFSTSSDEVSLSKIYRLVKVAHDKNEQQKLKDKKVEDEC